MQNLLDLTENPVYESDELIPNLIGSPWSGHRNFAYDLVKFLKPNLVVELGTHYGCSFFSFAQSVKDNLLKSNLVAVDTWQGDSHAGFYDDHVFNLVNKTVNEFYKNLNITLIRDTFDNALSKIEDNSIDLLHIDGFHTYEAVKHDFETWLPKVKQDGIVLLHDIAEYTGYGSADFWKELKRKYEYFEFNQSWGLGVVFPKGNTIYKDLLSQNFYKNIQIYEYKAKYELEYLKSSELDRIALERLVAINKMEEMIKDNQNTLNAQEKLLIERYEAMEKMESIINEKIEIEKAQEKLLIERQEAMEKMENIISEKINTEKAQEKLLIERQEAMNTMENIIAEKIEEISNQKQKINELKDSIQKREFHIASLNNELLILENEKSNLAKELEMVKTKYLKVKKWLPFLK